ncbi:MAG: hypothetical protein QN203_07930, partial [Armatimonadota bacterium]|nr:hypothetical protein [Armatimonadota bacterium]
KAWLAREGYNPDFGARPLRRLIQKEVENVIARGLLAGEFRPGQTIVVDLEGGRLTFTARVPAEVAT